MSQSICHNLSVCDSLRLDQALSRSILTKKLLNKSYFIEIQIIFFIDIVFLVTTVKRVFAYGESVDLSIIAGPAIQRGGPLQSTLRQSLDFDEMNRSYSNREEELVEAESLLNETVAAQERF